MTFFSNFTQLNRAACKKNAGKRIRILTRCGHEELIKLPWKLQCFWKISSFHRVAIDTEVESWQYVVWNFVRDI